MQRRTSDSRSRVLIVDNSPAFCNFLAETLAKQSNQLIVDQVQDAQGALKLLQEHSDQYIALVSGLVVEGAQEGEVLSFALEHQIPAIALTGSIDIDIRKKLIKQGVVDYFFKDSDGIHDTVRLIIRLIRNKTFTILIVDDSPSYCHYIQALLERQNYRVVQAESGEQTLAMLDRGHDIALVLLDYCLPGIGGYETIRRIRKRFNSAELPVIGISGELDQEIPAQIIKCGANDFFYKGFTIEEFHSRINNSIDLLESIRRLEQAAFKDFLTGLYNRQYFYTTANKYLDASDQEINISLGMIDVDFFKTVNDSFGHVAGDEVLKVIAQCLQRNMRTSDLLCRLGGEEFCLMFSGPSQKEAIQRLEQIRQMVADKFISVNDEIISVTISIGVVFRNTEDLDALINHADQALYQAKQAGRNQLMVYQG